MRSLSAEERAEKSQKIADSLFQVLPLDRPTVLHCFIAIEKFNEVDTTVIFRRLWNGFSQVTTVVPRVDMQTGEMRHLKFTPDTELVKNIWEIYEPEHNEYVETGEIDVVLVPLLCFDRQLHRVGYGKGFYDRFLLNLRLDSRTIGVSYFSPIDKLDDTHEGDIALGMCVTPTEIFHR